MASTTFGTLVYSVLENMQEGTQTATSIHFHRARRAIIDAIQSLWSEKFYWTDQEGYFQSVAGTSKYNAQTKLSSLIDHPLRVWYSDSPTAALNPADEHGVSQGDYALVTQEARDTTTNQGTFSRWAWWNRFLYTNAPLDGSVYVYVQFVTKPKIFQYTHDGTTWVYTAFTSNGIEKQFSGVELDAQTDSGWVQKARSLLIAQATRDLYLGAYQAKDPKKSLAESWIARRNEEFDILVVKYERGQGTKRTNPYLMPGD